LNPPCKIHDIILSGGEVDKYRHEVEAAQSSAGIASFGSFFADRAVTGKYDLDMFAHNSGASSRKGAVYLGIVWGCSTCTRLVYEHSIAKIHCCLFMFS
jgi:hypothetical protein